MNMNNKFLSQITSNKYLTYAFVIVVGLCLKSCGSMVFNRSSSPEVKPEVIEEEQGREERKAGSYQTVEYAGMTFEVPDYYGENISKKDGELRFEAEAGNKSVDLYFMSSDGEVSEKDFATNYEKVVDPHLESIKSNSKGSYFNKLESTEYKTSQSVQASKTTFEFGFSNGNDEIPMDGVYTLINNKDHKKVIIVMLLQSQEADYEYRNAFNKIIDEAKPLEVSSGADTSTPSTTDSSAIRPEFKQTMDNYEAWFDHYCEVMTAYKENPSDINLLTEMTSLLSEEVTMLDELEKMDQSQMNAAELAYYIEVTGRIQQKLIAVGS